LIELLRALADPQDPVALIAVLRGSLFGISDPDLFEFKQAGGWFKLFYDSSGAATKASSRVISALVALRQYYRWTRILPPAAAVDRILEETGYLASAATTLGGVDAGDLLHALDRVRQVAEHGGNLAESVAALEADAEAASEVESLPLETGRTDVVRLMNLHKAKGLEANVVFLADPAGSVRPRVDVHVERSGLKAQGWLRIVRTSEGSFAEKLLGEPLDWPGHAATETPYLLAEQDRLLYVAATRAREMLVISRWTGNLNNPAWGVLNDFLQQAPELALPSLIRVSPVEPLDCGSDIQAAAENARAASHAVAIQPSWSITSVTAEARQIVHMVRFVETAPDDPSKVLTSDTPSHRADAGQAWGTLIHGLLEHAMRHKNATDADLYRLGAWLSMEELQLRQVLDQAVQTVLEVSKAEFWQQAAGHEHSVETPFAYEKGDRQIVTGVIDLLFQDAATWRVIDYKTDVEEVHAASYAHQLRRYERALACVGIQKTSSEIYPVRLESKKDVLSDDSS
jgi:ATP-dependent helicase/nuclease subunit A